MEASPHNLQDLNSLLPKVAARCHSRPSGPCEVHRSALLAASHAWVVCVSIENLPGCLLNAWSEVICSSPDALWFSFTRCRNWNSAGLKSECEQTLIRVPLSYLSGDKRKVSWADAVWNGALGSAVPAGFWLYSSHSKGRKALQKRKLIRFQSPHL